MSALYLYGVTRPRELPSRLAGMGVEIVAAGPVAAVVRGVAEDPGRATRKSLLAHADVVETLHGDAAVLPARFGILFPDRRACSEFLEQFRNELDAQLERHQDTAELTLKGSYDEEILADLAPRLAPLRAGYRSSPTLENGMALGEAVAAALERRRAKDAKRILDVLAPLALDVRAGELHDEQGVLNVAFLVDRSRVEELSARLDDLAAELSPPARFKLTGPLPPYSFVELRVPEWVS